MLAMRSFTDAGPGFPDLLNWGALVADGVVLCKDGSLLAGWFYRGDDLDSSPDARLNWASERVNAALARLGGGWAMWVDAVRVPAQRYFDPGDSHFPDPISEMIDDERRAHFMRSGQHYETEYVLMIQYTPPLRSKGWLVELVYDGGDDGADASPADAILAGFAMTLRELEDSISSVLTLRRMRDFEGEDAGGPYRRSHIVNYLHFTVTGEFGSLNLPSANYYLDSVLGGLDCYPGDTPKIGDTYVAVVAVMGYPAASMPGILAVLDVVPIPLRFSSRFIFVDQPEADRQIKSIERKWKQRLRGFWADVLKMPSPRIDEDAARMAGEAGEAIARTNSALVGTGYYTPVVVLRGESAAQAIEYARLVSRELMRLGFATRIETINAMEAWLGSLPGHAVPNVRRPIAHTDNLADLLPLTSIWTGRPTNPCPFYPHGSPPLMQAATAGASPFWLNLHVGDIGHTLIFGPTGAGKSVLLATIALQALRYPGMTIWSFDKGLSAYVPTLAAGGEHYEIAGSGGLAFCPLSVLETEADLAWAEDWIATLYLLQHGALPLPVKREEIHRAMLRMRTSAQRSLTVFTAEVQSEDVREAVRHYTLSGPLGHLLDAEHDGLTVSRYMTFEIEDLMGMGEATLVPVLLYLFRRFERSLDGNPAVLLLDEAWIMLSHPVFREKIREWLKVLRKANCAVVLATQSLSDAARSGLLDVLMESCPTKIFLPNVDAGTIGTPDHPGPEAHYRAFGLNDQQIELIRTAVPKRDYYVVQPEGCRLINLQLGPVALAFVAAGSKEDIGQVGRLVAEHGAGWQRAWLQHKGVRI